ncbi:restriction endonuclease subunit S [Enterococcus faecalis]|uniref:restriction endonuclease subunit S n=1 Tax=Enterococcus faecalis TaxID=1351 RepID=UPI00032D69CF|nr:restriction endonuclease subunit S [Enterococcus faecalis]EGO2676842.1 restriction endonuclease subunit S [Enterococcus faecalis]EGO2721251.1 restriction endonuclease subunit S [Enterococcus faecalis]EGO6096045.1 restriction endonuclease subunit S [Enterococcus faecalis]EGO6138247.1 restriction endonuclease subunit S [Enterococcus faecalis]EGO6635675.1 restriction endonuclease subunit S [Enterococcus faecalis]
MKKEQKNSPNLRFKGFTEDWELCKVKDFLIESKIKGSNGKIAKKLTVKLWRKGIVAKEEVYEGSLATQYYVRKSGQFMYGKLDFLNQAFGIVPIELDGYESTVDSPSFDFKPLVDSVFFLEYVSLEKFYKYQGNIANGSRKAKRIHVETFFNMPLPTPSYKEQQKIGTLFKQLDDTITLHQRKLDQLKELKKAYLQVMFPAKDERAPKLRFADFEEEWELCKLGEIFKERSDRSGEGELISVTINSGIIKASELERKDNSSTDKSNYKVVKQGDIAYNSMRMWQGASGFSPFNGILSPAYTVISPKENIDGIFMAYMFKKHDMIQVFKRNSQGLTSDTWNLKFPTLSTIKIKMPLIEEQKKIAKLLLFLDKTIAIKQNKLNQLKSLKKAYLQNMFI